MNGYDVKGCGCCRPGSLPAPRQIANRPALSAIPYRIGDYASFRRAMIEEIPRTPELVRWTARSEADYGIVVLDLWAYVGDVLTFYQERIANEAFLRTATFRESVMRLAALLDYRPSPGAAAVAYVAFTLEKEKKLRVPAGLRMQSVPGPGEKPQKFETVEALEAVAVLNRPRVHGLPAPVNPFAAGTLRAALSAAPPRVGNAPLGAGTPLAIFDHRGVERKIVAALTSDGDVASAEWRPAVQRNDLRAITTRAAAFGRDFALFGSNAPPTLMVSQPAAITEANKTGVLWTSNATDFKIDPAQTLPLDREAPELKPGTRVLVVRSAAANAPAQVRLATISATEAKPHTLANISAKTSELTLDLAVASTPAFLRAQNSFLPLVIGDDEAAWLRLDGELPLWTTLGGRFTDVVCAGGTFPFARGVDGDLWFLAGGLVGLGGEFDLMTAIVAGGLPIVFVRWSDGGVRTIRQRAGGSWSAWQSLGGDCHRLAAATNRNGLAEVFIRDARGVLLALRDQAAGGAWTPWHEVGAGIDGDLAAVPNVNGEIDVFVRRFDGAVWRNRHTLAGHWRGWQSLGGRADMLAAEKGGDGRIVVAARRTDGTAWKAQQARPNDDRWNPWTPVAATRIDRLAVIPVPARPAVPAARGVAAVPGSPGGARLLARGPAKTLLAEDAARRDFRDLGVPMWPIPDRRNITVVELTSDVLPFAKERYPDTVTGDVVAVPLARLASLEAGRNVILDDAAQQPHRARVSSVSSARGHLIAGFTPALPRALDGASAFLFGNVARVTHGETVQEVVGSGSAAQRFQTFALKKSPLTYVPRPGAPNGVAAELEVRVDTVRWDEVATLLERGADERVFTVRNDEAGLSTLQFGGEPGARLSTGRNNVAARYRVGLGPAGNVRAGALSNLLDRPAGLKSAINPARAEGGAAAEPMSLIRRNAPNSVRTFSRIVSLRDFEDVARENAAVAKARATWTWQDETRLVQLTVAGEEGLELGPDKLGDVAADLDVKRDTNRPMHIRAHENIPFVVTVVVQVRPEWLLDVVRQNVLDALNAFFAFDSRDLGQPLHLSEVYAAVQKAKGVVAAVITRLRPKADASDDLREHIGIPAYGLATLAAADAGVTTQFDRL